MLIELKLGGRGSANEGGGYEGLLNESSLICLKEF